MNYYRYSDYLKQRFKTRVHKVSVDAGFSCPNRDGKLSGSGCIYCDNKAFNFQSRTGNLPPLEEQIRTGIEQARRRFKAEKFIVYFQAYTNTYAPLEELKKRYDTIKLFKDVVGISIATRPDCINSDILELLSAYAKDYEVWIEYGLQSIHDDTLKFINRGHGYDDFQKAFNLTRLYPIKICVHVILGLPNETPAMMISTAKKMKELRIDGIKIHPLHVVKGTELERLYKEGACTTLSFLAYKGILKEFLDCLWPETVVQRLSAYCPKDMLVAPDWVSQKQFF
jgi:uncharacterized protein